MQLSCNEGNIEYIYIYIYMANMCGHVEEAKEPIGPIERCFSTRAAVVNGRQPSLGDGPGTGTWLHRQNNLRICTLQSAQDWT